MATENNTTFVAADNSSLLGKELEFITIDAGEELANHQAKNETQNAIENTVRVYGNIVGAGPLFDTNASRTYIVEGTDMFVGAPASSGGTFTGCRYVKVGNLCLITGSVSNLPNHSGSVIEIYGLPFNNLRFLFLTL